MNRDHHNSHGQVKRAWPSELEAQRWARLLFAVGKHDSVNEAYKCRTCSEWHIGGDDKEATEALAAALEIGRERR